MNEEILAELRQLRMTAEDQERQMHWRAIAAHFTRFIILFCASRISPNPDLGVFAGAAGMLWLVMTAWHCFVLMPSRLPGKPEPPRRPLPPPVA